MGKDPKSCRQVGCLASTVTGATSTTEDSAVVPVGAIDLDIICREKETEPHCRCPRFRIHKTSWEGRRREEATLGDENLKYLGWGVMGCEYY
jgi:hypothetical protein